eukprot:TRINITY_DN403_c0_g1_i1.p1 TRINITY_DN403_c0_g1~~TRINITY_DN403_c0_g1_i1.p1  ORF type:complete len:214 (+),score=37.39 TRINITY_DN403_c0_g1_i1:130-771(+)
MQSLLVLFAILFVSALGNDYHEHRHHHHHHDRHHDRHDYGEVRVYAVDPAAEAGAEVPEAPEVEAADPADPAAEVPEVEAPEADVPAPRRGKPAADAPIPAADAREIEYLYRELYHPHDKYSSPKKGHHQRHNSYDYDSKEYKYQREQDYTPEEEESLADILNDVEKNYESESKRHGYGRGHGYEHGHHDEHRYEVPRYGREHSRNWERKYKY